jgi:hypothetical protein
MATASATNKRLSHGLTLPQASTSGRDCVVNNILSSLATLDETAQLHWVQETSRQVDHERLYQRTGTRYEEYDDNNDDMTVAAPVTGVGYRKRGSGSFTRVPFSAPSPAVPMGRPSKQGFFRRFMGIGPKVPVESEVLISPHPKRNVLVKNSHAMQVYRPSIIVAQR